MIIRIVNQQGGTGKSTMAINMADGLARKEHQVLVVDANPQESVARWNSVRNDAKFRTHIVRDQDISGIVKKALPIYEYFIVDAPLQ